VGVGLHAGAPCRADQRLVTVLRSITDGIVVLDRNWRYIYCNEQGARMLGMRPEKLLGACPNLSWMRIPKFHSQV